MNKMILNFENWENELKDKEIELFVCKGNQGFYIKDKHCNLYQVEDYFHASYLDRLISDKAKVTFYKIDNEAFDILERYGLEKIQ